MTVNELRKTCDNDDVIALSKLMIKQWKKLLPPSSKSSPSSSQNSKSTSKPSSSSSSHNSSSSDNNKKSSSHSHKDEPSDRDHSKSSSGSSQVSSSSNGNGNKSYVSSSTSSSSTVTDAVRLKCRELLQQALSIDGEMPEGCSSAEELAEELEDCIYAEFRNTDMRYKNRVRSRVANLVTSTLTLTYFVNAIFH